MEALLLGLLAYLVLILVPMIGWMMNLNVLIAMIGQEISTEFILRLVGVPLMPLGAIMGYFV